MFKISQNSHQVFEKILMNVIKFKRKNKVTFFEKELRLK